MPNVAHIKADGSFQNLEEHLQGTAKLAEEFAACFDSSEWVRIAARLHDLGKAHPEFQERIRRENGIDASEFDDYSGGRVNHSGAGAIFAMEKWPNIIGKTLAYLVAGHHAGLPDWFGGLDVRIKEEKSVADVLRKEWSSELEKIPSHLRPPAFAMQCKDQDAIAYHLWVRMLFSCLVDADFLDTEQFMIGEGATQRSAFPMLKELKERFDERMGELSRNAKDTPVNHIRAEILSACRTAATQAPGLFSLTVPTGGGKTLSGTAFALDHAVLHGKRRIIYVIPYTSIIEQTADILRKFFGPENVVEHHSNLAPEKETARHTLAAENWDAPVIVTTNVQFFESLYAAKPGRCRKLHNIVNSVIILDEAQLLPPDWLYPCVEAINRLVTDYSVTVVLSTATQPALPELCRTPHEIISDPAVLYRKLKRTDIVMPQNFTVRYDWPKLAEELMQHRQVLCVVNRRRDCFDLWKAMPEGTIHLSALMCGEHRSRVIAEIKDRLLNGEVCRVISTQLVEAGVDMDFPVVYRAMAGLDSINQAAGRCNREGKLDRGMVHVFMPPSPSPSGLLLKGEQTTTELLSLAGLAPDTPETYSRYFKHFYAGLNDTGKKWLHERLVKNVNPDGTVDFRTAGQEFNLIDDVSQAIIVRYGDNEALLERLRFGGPSREIMRRLQRYTVTINPKLAARLVAEKRVEICHDGILVQKDDLLYRQESGLDIFSEAYDPKELYC